jgi:hypothetical protein
VALFEVSATQADITIPTVNQQGRLRSKFIVFFSEGGSRPLRKSRHGSNRFLLTTDDENARTQHSEWQSGSCG